MAVVTSTYRYKRPPRRKKPVALEVPAVVTAKRSRRPMKEKAAAEMQLAPVSVRKEGTMQPSTPQKAERVVPAAILTIRKQSARVIPPDLLPETPEEHRRRGDAADALFREIRRRIGEQT
jgi:hypothetical protein